MDDRHSIWSNPGRHAARLHELPETPAAIADALELFVIHHAVARQVGFVVPANAEDDRALRRTASLLETAIGRDPRPLSEHRALADYLYVTCRDFALLAISALRSRGVPARLRAGFASYFNAGLWADHYVCEYRYAGGAWAILDAQMGPLAREGFKPPFDIADVPRTGFKPAASIWRAVRAGEIDARICGVPGTDIIGEWWVADSVLRDLACLSGGGMPTLGRLWARH